MTATTPEIGLRARLRRLAGRTMVFATVLGLCATGASGAAAATDPPADGEDRSVALHVSAGLRGQVAEASSTSAVVTIDNGTQAELSDGRIVVQLNRTALSDAEALNDWLDDGEAPGSFATVGAETSDPVDAGATSTTTIFVPEETLGALRPGIYPLRAELTGATADDAADGNAAAGDLTATSVLVVTPTTTPAVGVVVPITATPADDVLLTAEELATLTAPDGALTAQLDGVAGTTAVLAVDPSILTAIRVLGNAAPESATEWLARLDDLSNDRFALQFGDADPAVQAQAQLPALLAPTTFAPFLDPSRFPEAPATPAATGAPAGTPDPTPGTDGPVLPDAEELTALDGALPGILWPQPAVTQADLDAFAGYLGEDATTVVSSDTVGGSRAAHATAGGRDLLVTDAATSAALSDAASEADPLARQRLLAEAGAQLLLAGTAAPGAPLLVGLERDDTRTADALRDAIASVDTVGFDIRALRASSPAAATVSSEADTARATALSELLADEGSLTAFATVLEDPQVLLGPERIRILRTIAVGIPEEAFPEQVAAHRARTTEILGAVSIPESSTIQLLTANADLPIRVRNDLPWPVKVTLTVSPTDPRLEVRAVNEVEVLANTTVRAKVPVSARVGSGEVDLRLHLYSPTGVPIQGEERIRVAVRAEWETIGLAVLGSLIVLLIALGVIRTVRRKRREAVEEQAVETAVDELIEEKEAEAAAADPAAGQDPPPSKGTHE